MQFFDLFNIFMNKVLLFLLLGGMTVSSTAKAQLVQDSSTVTLNPNDTVDWSTVGVDSMTIPNPTAFTSTGGLTGEVSGSQGVLERLTEGTSWGGYFPDGEALIYNNFATSRIGQDIILNFNTPVNGVGVVIEPGQGSLFRGVINLYGASDNLLASYQVPWSYPTAYFGAHDTSGADSIYSVQLSAFVPAYNYEDFAISGVSLNVTPVPEPKIVAFLQLAFAMTVFFMRKRWSHFRGLFRRSVS